MDILANFPPARINEAQAKPGRAVVYQAALQTSSGSSGSWSLAWDCSGAPRNYNYKRYYQPGTGRYLGVDPIRGDDYSYVSSRPLAAIDGNGLLTVVVHGTILMGVETKPVWMYNQTFQSAISRLFGDPNITVFTWCGANSSGARLSAAAQLLEFLRNYRAMGLLRAGEKLNIIAHSHGGNVVKAFTILNKEFVVDNVVNLGTPQNGARFDRSVVRRVVNVYAAFDEIQHLGGKSFIDHTFGLGELGIAGRRDRQADINIRLPTAGYPNIAEIHSNLHSAGTIHKLSRMLKGLLR